MSTLDKKYKDRTPEETIQIITNFFTNRGYDVVIVDNEQTESGSWWCRVCIQYKGTKLMGANGKGTSEIFSLASGHAELYERYCNGTNTYVTPMLPAQLIKQARYKKDGYYFQSDEKELTFQEVMSSSKKMAEFFRYIDTSTNDMRGLLTEIFHNKFIGVPYYGLNVNDTKYILPELAIMAAGSSGMAAGNTLDEAIVQGSAELFEHYVHDKVYYPLDKYYVLNIKNMNIAPVVRHMIDEVESHNYKLQVYDFSYNYNIPVIGVLVADLENQTCSLNLGSAPVFDIALERCITEIFQGYPVLRKNHKESMFPYRTIDTNMVAAIEVFSLSFHTTYPEEIFYNYELMPDYNHEVFLASGDYSNKELREYCINYYNIMGWHVYYRNASLSPDVFAIQLYIDDYMLHHWVVKKACGDVSDNEKRLLIKLTTQWNRYFNNLFFNHIEDYEGFSKLIDEIKTTVLDNPGSATKYFYYINGLPSFDPFESYTRLGGNSFSIIETFYNDYSLANTYKNMVSRIKDNTFYLYPILSKYKTLYIYGLSDMYTVNEIKKIMTYYDIDFSAEDYSNMKNLKYILYKIIVENGFNVINSSTYKEYIQTYI